MHGQPLPRWLTPAVLTAGFAALALALRFYGIGDKSIWLDEAWSWRAARLSISDMVDWTAEDRHPPLYYAVLHGWVRLFGDAEWSLRAPSAIVGAASVALLAGAGWRAGGATLGVVAGVLLAVHPTASEFSQEARMYPLAGLLALAASVALALVIERPSPLRAAVYGACATALVYTHYSGFFVLAIHPVLVVAFALRPSGASNRLRTLAAGLLPLAAAAVAYIPWYPHLLDSARDGVGHLPDPSLSLLDLVISSQFGLQQAGGFWLAIALPLAGFGLWGIARRADRPIIVCVASLALVPFLQLAYSALRSPVLDPRQASPFIAGTVFISALGVIELGHYVADLATRRPLARVTTAVAAAALAAVLLAGLADWYRRGPREDWRAAAQALERSSGPAYVWRAYIDVPLRYYTPHELLPRDPASPPRDDPAASALVLSHETAPERVELLRGMSGFYVLGEAQDFTGITLIPLSPGRRLP